MIQVGESYTGLCGCPATILPVRGRSVMEPARARFSGRWT